MLPNGSILSFQNQWPCKLCINSCTNCECILYNTVTYLAACMRLFLDASEALPINGGLCKDQIVLSYVVITEHSSNCKTVTNSIIFSEIGLSGSAWSKRELIDDQDTIQYNIPSWNDSISLADSGCWISGLSYVFPFFLSKCEVNDPTYFSFSLDKNKWGK